MLKTLSKIPSYVYLAGIVGGTVAAYVFYQPSSNRKKRSNDLPRGLINYSNDCFINSLLQSLAASETVNKWLKESISSQSPQDTSITLFDTLVNIFTKINREENKIDLNSEKNTNQLSNSFDYDQQDFYAAQDLKKALNAHNWLIQSEEHDCHELFHVIMDVLDEESLESKKYLRSLNYFSSFKRDNVKTNLKNPFLGYLIVQLQCLDCNYKYPFKLESFYSLSLLIPQSNNRFNRFSNRIDLSDCINNYFKTEHILDMKCEMCISKKTDVMNKNQVKSKGFIKKQAIAKLPECLCLQIQRNSWSDYSLEMIKQQNFVQFPTCIKIDNSKETSIQHYSDLNFNKNEDNSNLKNNINMMQFLKEDFSLKQVGIGNLIGGNTTQIKESMEYKNKPDNLRNSREKIKKEYFELSSAIVHYGNAHTGHFISFRKPLKNKITEKNNENSECSESLDITNKNKKPSNWLQISDTHIQRCKEFQLLSNNVYMLFYDKRSC